MNHNKPIPHAMLLPNREAINTAQVSLLLSVAQSLVACLNAHNLQNPEPQDTRPQIDGGVKSAAETTFIHVCDRLDKIIEDSSRWGFDTQQGLEKRLSLVYDAQINLLRAQAKLAEEALKPHVRYRPKLIHLESTWTAILGDLDDIDNSICGIGNTPQEALDAFDAVFTGHVPPHLIEWLRLVEAANLRGEPIPPLNNNNNEKQVDRERNNNPETTEIEGEIPQGNSPDNEADENRGGPPSGSDGSPGSRDAI